jgi:hypothetical protein
MGLDGLAAILGTIDERSNNQNRRPQARDQNSAKADVKMLKTIQGVIAKRSMATSLC